MWMLGARSHILTTSRFKRNVSFLTSINVLFKVTCWSVPYLLCCSSIGILPSLCIFLHPLCMFSAAWWLALCVFLSVTVWPTRKAETSQKMSRRRISETTGRKVRIWRRVRTGVKQVLYRGVVTAGWSNSKFQAESYHCLKCDIVAKLLLPIMCTVTLCSILFYTVLRKSMNPEVMANKLILCEECKESFLHTSSITLLQMLLL